MMRDWGVCRDCALKENCAEYKPNHLQCEDYERYKEVLTNEEWFCNLPTNEKAKWITENLSVYADDWVKRDVKLLDFETWVKWLKERHTE